MEEEACSAASALEDTRERVTALEAQLAETNDREEHATLDGAEELMEATLEVARLQDMALELEEELCACGEDWAEEKRAIERLLAVEEARYMPPSSRACLDVCRSRHSRRL
jgi:vacuolar-type H+-ATPase subunit I/STV1